MSVSFRLITFYFMASQQMESPKQSEAKVYLVMSEQKFSDGTVENVMPLVFSSFKKAEKYCLREAVGWKNGHRDYSIWTGETNPLDGPLLHSLQIVPMIVNAPVEVWEVTHSCGEVVDTLVSVNGANGANRYIENEIQLEIARGITDSWYRYSDFHWNNIYTKEAWIAAKKTE